jgi:hypothetical protein
MPGSSVGTKPSRRRRSTPRGAARLPLAAAAIALCSLALAAPALALTKPSVSTGPAHQVSYASAVLTGTVNPNGSSTSYYFEYGSTKRYGGQSTIASAGSGTRSVKVSIPIGGLRPITLYHYRLVAVNGSGASIGSDRVFLTTKVPLSLQILASPNPVPFGGAVTVQGTLSGTNNGGRAVVLQANQFPFTAGFQNFANAQLTDANGGFNFPILSLTLVTKFRVVTTTSSPVISPEVEERVAVRVSSHVAHTRRVHFARIYGTVTPAADGMRIGILRITRARGVLVGGTVLRHRNASSSRFSRVVHVRRGIYRVLAQITSGAQVSNYGQPLLIR